MSVTPMTGRHIQAAGYSRGRGRDVDVLVIHTAEGSRTVASLGRWFAEGTSKASSNAGIDSAGDYATFVGYGDTPWTNPPLNRRADTLELCAFKSWSREQWLAAPKMLEATAHWIAWRSAVRGLPVRHLSRAQLKAGVEGTTDHKTVNDVYGDSDHTDVGPGFPWDVVINRAQELAGVAGPPPAQQQQVKPAKRADGGPDDRWLGLQDPPLRGQDVVGVQHALNACGNDLDEDGVYGRTTADLLQVFKTNRGIDEAGCGPLTWKALRDVVHGGGA